VPRHVAVAKPLVPVGGSNRDACPLTNRDPCPLAPCPLQPGRVPALVPVGGATGTNAPRGRERMALFPLVFNNPRAVSPGNAVFFHSNFVEREPYFPPHQHE